jgi:hypothetical protein
LVDTSNTRQRDQSRIDEPTGPERPSQPAVSRRLRRRFLRPNTSLPLPTITTGGPRRVSGSTITRYFAGGWHRFRRVVE